MSVLSCVLAGLVMLLCPYLIRVEILALPEKLNRQMSCSYLTGVLLFYGILEALFLTVQLLGKGLSCFRLEVLLFAAACLLLAVLLFLFHKPFREMLQKERQDLLAEMKENRTRWIALAVCFAVCLASLYLVQKPLAEEMYDTAERTQMIVRSGGFYGIDPLTGQLSAGISAKERFMGLPAFYAALCSLFHVPAILLLLKVVPVCMLVYAFSLLSLMAERLKQESFLPLCVTSLLALLCGGSAYRTPFYDLLHLPYEGRTFLAILLLPAGALLLERSKKWWQFAGMIVLVLAASLFFAGPAEGCLIAGLGLALWSVVLWISRYIS